MQWEGCSGDLSALCYTGLTLIICSFCLYPVTEKVYESESCTDSEDDFAKSKPPAAHKQPALPAKKEPKEERKNLKKGAATANRANKQVSIMGFFQKK